MMYLGMNMEIIQEQEIEPGLGSGGIGRLASCFLDSMATLQYPCLAYGLRYTFSKFQ